MKISEIFKDRLRLAIKATSKRKVEALEDCDVIIEDL